MKTIIVPMDLSIASIVGLRMALLLGAKTPFDIKILHVIETKDNVNNDPLNILKDLAKIKIINIIKMYCERCVFKGTLKYVILDGDLFEEISLFTEKCEDPLIILSMHAESGLEKIFNGGNVYKMITSTHFPVITIRKSIISSQIEKIVLPLDITFQTREKVNYTVMLAKLFGAEIHLVSVRLSNIKSIEDKLQQYIDQVSSFIISQNVPFVIDHLQGDNLTDITIEYADSVNADLISVMTEQETNICNLLQGSYAHQMVNKSFIPVLSFPTSHITMVSEDFRTEGVNY